MKTKFIAVIVCAVTGIAASTSDASAQQPTPRLTMPQARAIALKAAPGKIADAEYEREDGSWRYSFDIRQGKRIHEIGVDANTGVIVENDFENPLAKD